MNQAKPGNREWQAALGRAQARENRREAVQLDQEGGVRGFGDRAGLGDGAHTGCDLMGEAGWFLCFDWSNRLKGGVP